MGGWLHGHPPLQKGNMSREHWIPKCLQCGETTLILAPADSITVGVLMSVHVYCPNCQWDGRLADEIKKIYVRL